MIKVSHESSEVIIKVKGRVYRVGPGCAESLATLIRSHIDNYETVQLTPQIQLRLKRPDALKFACSLVKHARLARTVRGPIRSIDELLDAILVSDLLKRRDNT